VGRGEGPSTITVRNLVCGWRSNAFLGIDTFARLIILILWREVSRQFEHFGPGGKEEFTYLGHVRHTSARKRCLQFMWRNRLLTQQETNVLQVLFVPAGHLGEDQVNRRRTVNRQPC
jgi:hypothetical protein